MRTDASLIAQPGPGGSFKGFPGGKIEPGERQQALIRELHEELGILSSAACLAPFVLVTAYGCFHLLVYLLRRWSGYGATARACIEVGEADRYWLLMPRP
jgi:8-oxo-dGTP pyrophosphatase MutT (NUDIX family)